MNRIIIIGNGFDRAHNLKTGYEDFINDYWSEFTDKVINKVAVQHRLANVFLPYADDYVSLELVPKNNYPKNPSPFTCEKENPYNELLETIQYYNEHSTKQITYLNFKNKFLGHISNLCSLQNWVDIENEYYDQLKKLLSVEDSRKRKEKIVELNKDFDRVKDLLEKHLIQVTINEQIEKHLSIQDAFLSLIDLEDIAYKKQNDFLDSILIVMDKTDNADEMQREIEEDPSYLIFPKKEAYRYYISQELKNGKFKKSYCTPTQTLILNFNYTKTAEKLYINEDMNYEVINIHGELENGNNPIIFGYGDELDDDYKRIEKLQDNDFLDNIKSINYHKTRNYRNFLKFIESGLYQVFVMGHSCGNSDRTLLNTLFEHDNCASIKVYYRQYKDGTDNHSDLIRNISRNFNDKPRMRDVVVNREDCYALVPMLKSTK